MLKKVRLLHGKINLCITSKFWLVTINQVFLFFFSISKRIQILSCFLKYKRYGVKSFFNQYVKVKVMFICRMKLSIQPHKYLDKKFSLVCRDVNCIFEMWYIWVFPSPFISVLFGMILRSPYRIMFSFHQRYEFQAIPIFIRG